MSFHISFLFQFLLSRFQNSENSWCANSAQKMATQTHLHKYLKRPAEKKTQSIIGKFFVPEKKGKSKDMDEVVCLGGNLLLTRFQCFSEVFAKVVYNMLQVTDICFCFVLHYLSLS